MIVPNATDKGYSGQLSTRRYLILLIVCYLCLQVDDKIVLCYTDGLH